MKQGMNLLWPTKVKLLKISEELTEAALQDVFAIEHGSGKFGQTNIFDQPGAGLAALQEEVKSVFNDYLNEAYGHGLEKYPYFFLRAWITRNTGNTGYVSTHNHAGAQFSSVFYLMTENQGDLVLMDPRGNANRGYNSDLVQMEFANEVLKPEAGDAIVFPSFLYHHVLPHSTHFRVSLAVDLFLRSNDD